MSDVSRILASIERGDPHAAEQLMPLVHDELRKLATALMAKEASGQDVGRALAELEDAVGTVTILDDDRTGETRGRCPTRRIRAHAGTGATAERITARGARRRGKRSAAP